MPEKKNSKILIIILLIIIILEFIAIAYLSHKNYKLNIEIENFIVENNVQTQRQPEVVQTDKENYTQSKSTLVLNSPIKTDYHIGKTYGFYKNSLTNKLEMHDGIDFVVKSGTAVSPVLDGTITEVGFNNDLGNYVTVLHSNGYKSRYCNLNSFRVKKGETVSTRNVIATTGNTGISEEPHLGFLLYDSEGNSINPTKYFNALQKPTILPDMVNEID